MFLRVFFLRGKRKKRSNQQKKIGFDKLRESQEIKTFSTHCRQTVLKKNKTNQEKQKSISFKVCSSARGLPP